MARTIIAYRPFLTLLQCFKWHGICYKRPIRNDEFEKYFADSFTTFRCTNNLKVLKNRVFFTVTTSRNDLLAWKLLLISIKSYFLSSHVFSDFWLNILMKSGTIHEKSTNKENPREIFFCGFYLFSDFFCMWSTSSKSVNVSKQLFHKKTTLKVFFHGFILLTS